MNTGTWVTILGVIVSLIGWSMLDTRLGAGILGFGLAHIVLGLLDASFGRQVVRQDE